MKKLVLLVSVLCAAALSVMHLSAAPQKEETITFSYNNEELVDVINFIASKKGVNIIMPVGPNAITSKVTLNIEQPMSIERAWDMLLKVLDIAGYSAIADKEEYKFTIARNNKAVVKEAVPLFVSSDPEKLPDTDDRIRFLYYLTNIKLSDAADATIPTILKEFLPVETASYQFDPKVNAILVTEKASNIKAVMRIIATIDQTTFQEQLEILRLRYTEADMVARLFTDNILKVGTEAAKYRMQGKRGESTYFSENIKIIPETRTNKLIVLGKAQAVTRAKEFIYKYIDVELESGKSVLHVYQLLYLDAVSFAPVLESIVRSERSGGTGQSLAAGSTTGVERYFEGVIVKADQPKDIGKGQVYGSNKLIIAAKNEDWKHIQRIIEQLDKPQPQVIIEVLIADLTLDDLRQLGASFRNPAGLPVPNSGTDIQAAQIGPVVLDSVTDPTTVGGDLLATTLRNPISGGTPTFISQASLNAANQPAELGSTLISINDSTTGKTWSLIQILQLFSHTKILSHPHVITTNNKEASVSIGDERLVAGEVIQSAAAPTIKQERIEAKLTVRITPRISSANDVTLNVTIDVREFQAGTDTIITRTIVTNASVKSEDILALGGLIRTNTQHSVSETPILGRIPILGWLFKKRKNRNTKTNLTVFISPIIVQPRLRQGINDHTKDYITLAQRYAEESQLFDTLRDPITRFFFRADAQEASSEAINDFLAKDEFKRDLMTAPPSDYVVEEEETQKQQNPAPKTTKRVKEHTKSGKNSMTVALKKSEKQTPEQAAQRDEELKKMLLNMENPLLST